MPPQRRRSARGPRSFAADPTTATGGRPGSPDNDDSPAMVTEVRRALAQSHPLSLLLLASALLTASDPRTVDPVAAACDEDDPGLDLELVLSSLIEMRRSETTALLTALAALIDDEPTSERIARELATRPHKPPRWLRRLTPLRVGRVVEMAHVLRDGDNTLIEVVTGADQPLTVIIYIDHNLGTVVKDAFVVPEPGETLLGRFRELAGDDPDTTITELDRADARARITEAIELGAITYPPFETDTWPGCRPLIEWVVRHLPEGGTGYVRPEWSEQQRDALVERFLASGLCAVDDVEAAADLAHMFVWFACDYGPGDPLRWSPVSVEILLADFLHRKVILPEATMRHAPEVLRAFVRFAHRERGISSELTEATLATLDREATTYLERLDADGTDDTDPFDTAAIQAALLADAEQGSDLLVDDDGEVASFNALRRELLVEAVGTEQALVSLTTEPLPDEALDLSEVAEDIRARVETIAALVDGGCDALLDVEHRTAARRLLADVAAGDPAIFRRRSRDDTAAAAIVWLVGKANDAVAHPSGDVTTTALLDWFGVSGNPSQRAVPMLRAIGAPDSSGYTIVLGSPRYLVAAKRARLIELEQQWR